MRSQKTHRRPLAALAAVLLVALCLVAGHGTAHAGALVAEPVPDGDAPVVVPEAPPVEQTAATEQTSAAAAEVDAQPMNLVISIRVNSPGNDGPITQASTVAAAGTADNASATEQAAEAVVESLDQTAGADQLAGATAAANEARPANLVVSVRVNSAGDTSPATQANAVVAGGAAENDSATDQRAAAAPAAESQGRGRSSPTQAQAGTAAPPAPAEPAASDAPSEATVAAPQAAPASPPPTCIRIATPPDAPLTLDIAISIVAACDAADSASAASSENEPLAADVADTAPRAAPLTGEVLAARPVARARVDRVQLRPAAQRPRELAAARPVRLARANAVSKPSPPQARPASVRRRSHGVALSAGAHGHFRAAPRVGVAAHRSAPPPSPDESRWSALTPFLVLVGALFVSALASIRPSPFVDERPRRRRRRVFS